VSRIMHLTLRITTWFRKKITQNTKNWRSAAEGWQGSKWDFLRKKGRDRSEIDLVTDCHYDASVAVTRHL
jgi:hypothetical protein